MREKFLLIDGSSLIFRAFFAIRNLTTKDGIHTNAVYGFLNMYRNALSLIEPDYVMVAFDRSGPTFRNKDYEAYKGTRQKTPPELSHQFGILKDILKAMKVKTIDLNDFEADDIIGTLAQEAAANDIECYMLTGDRDYFQLVGEKSKVLYTKKGISELEIYDIDKIKEKYDLAPKDLIEIKGLMGDTSDNIPGVPGVGEKTAIKLIKEFKTIEGIYENIDKVSGKKLKENLTENEMTAFLSRKLGTIFTQVPLEEELAGFKLQEADKEELYKIYKKLEFNKFLAELDMDVKVEADSADLVLIESGDIDDFIDGVKKSKKIYFEVLDHNVNYVESRPEYMALLNDDKKLLLLDLEKDADLIKGKIKPLLEDDELEKISFDIKKAMYLLKVYDIDIKKNYTDLVILSYLLDPSRSGYTIADIAEKYLGKNIFTFEDLLGKGKKQKSFSQVERKELISYVKNIMETISLAKDKMVKELEELDMIELYENVELPLIKVLSDMELAGVEVDKGVLEKIDKEIADKIDDLEKAIYEQAGTEFNINSTKQLGEILFDKLGLPVIKKNKTGYSTDASVLEKLKSSHEIVENILDYRGLKKLKTTYIDGLYPYIREDKRIHSIFKQTATATGRLSSIEPNLQNIPIRTEEGRSIRKAFVAGQDKVLVSADYSQIELRLLAALSGDDTMIDSFKHGIDIHAKTASEVFHVPVDEVTKDQRRAAKAVNFGIVYGISDYGLSEDLDIPRKTAKEYIDKYKATYPKIDDYMKDIVKTTKKLGYVETLFHRRRMVPELQSKNFNIRSFGERIALNTPIQGSAADIIKIAMVKTHERLKEEGLRSKLILQIHDELIIEALEDEVKKVEAILKEEMENAVVLPVDLIVEVEKGRSWYEA